MVTFRHHEGANEGVNTLYQSIMEKPGIRLPELSTKLHVPAKNLERWIKKLRDENKVEEKVSN